MLLKMAGFAGVIIGLCFWAFAACLCWLLSGILAVFWFLFHKFECKSLEDFWIVIAGKLVGLLVIVGLSVKYGFLGPLLTAIVRALKSV